MYCPSCGSNNQGKAGTCGHCGSNLHAVSDLMAGRLADRTAVEDWTRTLLRRNYSGRRKMIAGLLLLPAAFFLMRMLMITGIPPFVAFLWTCWIFLWGVIWTAEGAGMWIASQGQIKALGYAMQRAPDSARTAEQLQLDSAIEPAASNDTRESGVNIRHDSQSTDTSAQRPGGAKAIISPRPASRES